jgi:hypothetical protein
MSGQYKVAWLCEALLVSRSVGLGIFALYGLALKNYGVFHLLGPGSRCNDPGKSLGNGRQSCERNEKGSVRQLQKNVFRPERARR